MMRRLSALLALVLCVGLFTAGAGTNPAGLTTMVFQDGFALDGTYPGAYTGCSATYLAHRDGDGGGLNRGGCDTLNITSDQGTYGQCSALIKFDISDLPDDAIIYRARLWIYQITPDVSIATGGYNVLSIFRMGRNWTEGPGACAGAQNGYADFDSAGGGKKWANDGTTTSTNGNVASAKRWGSGTTAPDSATWVTSFVGADTVTSVEQNAITTWDHPGDPITTVTWRTGSTAAKRLGWVVADITGQVRLWHTGANANYGVVIKDQSSTTTATLGFASDDYTGAAAWARHRRPMLVVDYVVPSSGGTGSVRRVVGARR